MKQTTKECGNLAEDTACDFLLQRGLKLQHRNYYCQQGEIDLFVSMPTGVITISGSNYNENVMKMTRRLSIPRFPVGGRDVEMGIGLLSYATDLFASGKQAAGVADRIFKGAKPSEIPVDFTKKFLLIVNLNIAQELGLTIPDTILEIAEVIE